MGRIRSLFDRLTQPEEPPPAAPATRGRLLDRVVGRSAVDYLDVGAPEHGLPVPVSARTDTPPDPDFASALKARLDEVQDRLESEEVTLAEVDRAASDYLGTGTPPLLRLLR